MIKLFVNTFNDFRNNLKKYVTLELISILFTSFIWVPVLTYIYKNALKWMGASSLLNHEIYNIAVNYKGVLSVLLIFVLCVTVVFLQVGVLIIISQKDYFHQKADVIDALIHTTKLLPKLFHLGTLQMIPFLLLIILPVNSPFLRILFDKFNLSIFLAKRLNESKLWIVLYCVVCILLVYAFLKSIFAIHFIILKENTGTKAILSSIRLTRRKEWRILLYLLFINAVIFALGYILKAALMFLISLLLDSIQNMLLSNYILTLSSYLTYLFIMLIMPLNVIFVTHLFYNFIDPKGDGTDSVPLREHPRLTRFENKVISFFVVRRYLFSTIFVIYLTVTFLLNYSFSEKLFNWDVIVTAHRGYHKAPENSISGISEAILLGADAVEIDVQMTKDGVLILNHDMTLRRVSGVAKKVSDLTYSEIQRLSIGTSDYPDEKIPTLEEALQAISGNAIVIIDVKVSGQPGETAEKIVNLIEVYQMTENAYVQSFHQGILKEIRNLNEDIRIGQVLYASTGDLGALDVDFYTIHQFILSEEFLKNAHGLDRQVFVWTVNLEQNIRQVLEFRVDGIITDYPEKVRNVMNE